MRAVYCIILVEKTMIEIKNLTKNYNKDFSALLNINHSFKEPLTMICGIEGAGKTTLLNILAGLDTSYSGKVTIHGKDRKEIKNQEMLISYIMEKPVFFERKSVMKNLQYVFKVQGIDHKSKESVEKIRYISNELGFLDSLSKPLKKCAVYVRALVGLARAYLKNSTILLIDEPLKQMISQEKLAYLQKLNWLINKLSCTTIVAETVQNWGLFGGVEVIKLDFGTKVE